MMRPLPPSSWVSAPTLLLVSFSLVPSCPCRSQGGHSPRVNPSLFLQLSIPGSLPPALILLFQELHLSPPILHVLTPELSVLLNCPYAGEQLPPRLSLATARPAPFAHASACHRPQYSGRTPHNFQHPNRPASVGLRWPGGTGPRPLGDLLGRG